MGAASSIFLTEEKKVLIVIGLKGVYEDVLKNGKSEEEMRELVIAEYEKVVKLLAAGVGESLPLPNVSSDHPHSHHHDKYWVDHDKNYHLHQENTSEKKHESMDKKVTTSYLNKVKKTQQHLAEKEAAATAAHHLKPKHKETRRKSFDPRASYKTALATVVEGLAVSRSDPALELAAVDIWDSVTTQPYCDICKMALKNSGFLERHLLYSNLHLRNVKILSGEEDVEEPVPVVEEEVPEEIVDQEEGKDYRLIYSGSKLYWRTQNTVEFDIYHHFATQTIEIIPHNMTHQVELGRLYLSYEKVLAFLHDIIEAEVDLRIKTHHFDRFAAEDIDQAAVKADAIVLKVASFLVSHLYFEVDENHGYVAIQAQTGDDFPVGFLLDGPPHHLYPVKLTKRRRSSAAEIEEQTQNVTSDLCLTDKLLDTAEHYREFAHAGAPEDVSTESPTKDALSQADVLEEAETEVTPQASPMLA